jgi:hypothetical protein
MTDTPDRRFLVVRRERGRLVFQIWHQPMPPTWPKHEREFTVAVVELAAEDQRDLDELRAAWLAAAAEQEIMARDVHLRREIVRHEGGLPEPEGESDEVLRRSQTLAEMQTGRE